MNYLVESFKSYLVGTGLSKSSARNYATHIERFLVWFSNRTNKQFVPAYLNGDLLSLFIQETLLTGIADSSYRQLVASLRKFSLFLNPDFVFLEELQPKVHPMQEKVRYTDDIYPGDFDAKGIIIYGEKLLLGDGQKPRERVTFRLMAAVSVFSFLLITVGTYFFHDSRMKNTIGDTGVVMGATTAREGTGISGTFPALSAISFSISGVMLTDSVQKGLSGNITALVDQWGKKHETTQRIIERYSFRFSEGGLDAGVIASLLK